jgi:tetratricopeptide (TPR) repeat protein
MSTTQLGSSRPAAGGRPSSGIAGARRAISSAGRAPVALSVALLVLILYAAFEHGAIDAAAETRIEVAIAAVAALAVGAWLWSGTLRLAAPGLALAGIGLLSAFAVWSGISLIWSVSPDHTWTELNLAIAYVIVLCLGVAVGASLAHSIELVGKAIVLAALVVTVYALGQKVLPGLHADGIFNLNRTGSLPRLQLPLGYWNALALFISFGVPVALALAVDRGRSTRARLLALGAAELMLLAIGLTYSRGGVLALAIGLAVGVSLSGARLRSLMWLAVALIATLPPLLFGLLDHQLTTGGVALGKRELAGAELGLILGASLIALWFGGRRLIEQEARTQLAPDQVRAITRALVALAGAAVVIGVLALAVSSRGLTGTVSHAWHSFTTAREASVTNPNRLLSADSANRWVWWKEAANAFGDRPIGGWGAGSFGVVHLLYRRNGLSVQQPHSVPLQFLAETGIVGAILAIGAFALLLTVGFKVAARARSGRSKLLASALLGAVVIYAVHAVYDWDWDIPAVTLPALVILGVLAGTAGRERQQLDVAGPGLRMLAIAPTTLCLCAFALSAALPALAASEVNSALVAAASASSGSLDQAQASASLASKLDPLSDAGLKLEATIALRRGQPVQARRYLLAAINRQPTDPQVWHNLAFVELTLGHTRAAIAAAHRMLALDPRGKTARATAAALAQRQRAASGRG